MSSKCVCIPLINKITNTFEIISKQYLNQSGNTLKVSITVNRSKTYNSQVSDITPVYKIENLLFSLEVI